MIIRVAYEGGVVSAESPRACVSGHAISPLLWPVCGRSEGWETKQHEAARVSPRISDVAIANSPHVDVTRRRAGPGEAGCRATNAARVVECVCAPLGRLWLAYIPTGPALRSSARQA